MTYEWARKPDPARIADRNWKQVLTIFSLLFPVHLYRSIYELIPELMGFLSIMNRDIIDIVKEKEEKNGEKSFQKDTCPCLELVSPSLHVSIHTARRQWQRRHPGAWTGYLDRVEIGDHGEMLRRSLEALGSVCQQDKNRPPLSTALHDSPLEERLWVDNGKEEPLWCQLYPNHTNTNSDKREREKLIWFKKNKLTWSK